VLILYADEFSDGQSKFLRVFNFSLLGYSAYSRNSQKKDAREKLVFYSTRSLFELGKFPPDYISLGWVLYQGFLYSGCCHTPNNRCTEGCIKGYNI